ncbi:MAG TPA: bifunctional 3-phenylpropionate/cinnamic acid dioxygenase ferredoxin subunit [Chloroflexota bacterium]|nr:bifunctional 3-phenylpropionate/cinnamic acid dioxygenase ferredoxin subunit [Chloroflexota bacterium]
MSEAQEVAALKKVATLQQIEPGNALCVTVGSERIALFNVDGAIYATDDTCSHAQASLSDGWLEDNEITCPLHGAIFDVTTGQPLTLPATKPVRTYEVHIEGDDIYLEL